MPICFGIGWFFTIFLHYQPPLGSGAMLLRFVALVALRSVGPGVGHPSGAPAFDYTSTFTVSYSAAAFDAA